MKLIPTSISENPVLLVPEFRCRACWRRFSAAESYRANEARIDFEGDGIFDTPWQTDKDFFHQYVTVGTYNPKLEVRNADGIDSITKQLIVIEKPTAVEEDQSHSPTAYGLSQNFPNPFNASTTIRYQLPQGARVQLTIYDILGQKVRTVVDEVQPAGFYTVTWNGKDENGWSVASGIYLYTIQADEFRAVKKALLLR